MGIFGNIFGDEKRDTPKRINSFRSLQSRSLAAGRIRSRNVSVPKDNTAKQRTFEAAQMSLTTNDWINVARSVNWDIRQGNVALRARARELSWNDPYAKRFLSMLKKNVVGPKGFIHKNKAYDWVLRDGKKVKQFDTLANSLIEEGFWDWNNKEYCSITGELFLTELEQMLLRTVAVDGEVFVVHVEKPGINKHGYTLQVLEADYVDERFVRNLGNGNFIDMGIEYNIYKRPVAYYFKKVTPGYEDYLYSSSSIYDYERIPAENVTHLFIKETPSQRRGISWFVPSAIRMKMLMGFEEASLVNARASACKTGILKPTEIANAEFAGSAKTAEGDIVQDLSAGEIYKVPYGYDWVSHNPVYPHEQHGPFKKVSIEGIAAGLDASSLTLGNDYSQVNYSSGRLALGDEQETWRMLQDWFIMHFKMDVVKRWLGMALLVKAINLPAEKFTKFNQPNFFGRTWPYIDPEKDINAEIKAISFMLKTYEEYFAERGIDLEEFIEQKKYEQDLFQKAGLIPQNISISIGDSKPENKANNNKASGA